MSTIDDVICPDMSKIPTKCLERAYWRRKLPPAFRFFLEMLARELMLSQPRDVNGHAATFFEELLIQRDTELSMLPYVSYLDKLMKKRGIVTTRKPREEAPKQQADPPSSVRCARCGRGLRTNPATGTVDHVGAPSTQPGAPPPPPECSLTRCARCGRSLKQESPAPGGLENAETQTTGPSSLMECSGECRVIALSQKNDAFGRLPCRRGDQNDGELLNCRSLAYLVDY